MSLAPIVIFTYKRLETLKSAIDALKKNILASESELIIFSDAALNEKDKQPVANVREYIRNIQGFKTITIYESSENKGLAMSIIDGVTKVVDKFGKIIVLEDDLIVSSNFLSFMNQSLDYFQDKMTVFSVAGYTTPINKPKGDIYFTMRASSWGWATWRNRWNNVDWSIKEYQALKKDKRFKVSFNRMGSDMYKMLNDQIEGRINSWAIRWCFDQYLRQAFTVYPTISKVINIGTGGDATHTKDKFNRFRTNLDKSENTEFKLNPKIELDEYYLRQFCRQFSVLTRIKYRLLNLIS